MKHTHEKTRVKKARNSKLGSYFTKTYKLLKAKKQQLLIERHLESKMLPA